ncbi:hypothetical protein [Gordonia sp. NPDC003376]
MSGASTPSGDPEPTDEESEPTDEESEPTDEESEPTHDESGDRAAGSDDAESDNAGSDGETDEADDEVVPAPPSIPEPRVEPGEVLFTESGGSWWVVAIGPILIGAVLAMEISGPGQVHWPIITIFGLIVIGFSVIQVVAARRHVSVELTETTLRQGTRTVALADIARIYPENNGPKALTWESAPALGELHGVPRRRKGVGVELSTGAVAQAWARDVSRFRSELSEAHLAVRLGLPPRGSTE